MLHVAVLPAVLTLLIAIHFWRIRKDGGLSRPEASAPAQAVTVTVTAVAAPAKEKDKKKVYGLQGFVRGPFTKVGNVPDNSVFSWPNLLMAELFVFVLTVAAILVLSLMFNAPLEQPVNVMHPPNPAKAPWYFLGLQEMVSYSAFWGGVGVPGVMVLLLLLVPYIDRKPGGVGRWFASERLLANTIFLTLVIAQHDVHYYRHVLPRAELVNWFLPGERRTMRLSLAIASFVVLIVHGVVFYDQFFHHWERHQTAYFEQARTLSKNERERAELDERAAPHRADTS